MDLMAVVLSRLPLLANYKMQPTNCQASWLPSTRRFSSFSSLFDVSLFVAQKTTFLGGDEVEDSRGETIRHSAEYDSLLPPLRANVV